MHHMLKKNLASAALVTVIVAITVVDSAQQPRGDKPSPGGDKPSGLSTRSS